MNPIIDRIYAIERHDDTYIVVPTLDPSRVDYEQLDVQTQELLGTLEQGGYRNLIIDFQRTRFLSSQLLGVLVTLWKRVASRNGRMVLCGLTEQQQGLLKGTTLDTLWPVRPSRQEALAELVGDPLRHTQKLEILGQLAGGIAHDFNNLLTVMIGNAMLALDKVPADTRQYLQNVLDAGQRASDLVRKLLTFSRKVPAKLEAAGVDSIVSAVLRVVQDTFDRRIHISVHHQRPSPVVLADAGQIEQVLLNLCINARDAVEARKLVDEPWAPQITIRTFDIRTDHAYCKQHREARPGRYACLSVSDTGIGMDARTKAHVFEPFFTTKPVGKGTGLGLAVSYGIVQQHGGWFEVESQPRKGTTFTFTLPIADQTPPTRPEGPAAGRVDGQAMWRGTETILLVDDEEMVRELARTVLEGHGYAIIEACNGQEALDLYVDRHGEIGLVLLDLSMPQLAGDETLRTLRLFDPNVKVMLMSGYEGSARMDALRDLGPNATMAKPFQNARLARLVREVLDGK